MGNPLSCFIANMFLSKFEIKAKETMTYFPRIWIRYVDDVFVIFNKRENLQTFLTQLNSFYNTIKFTYEIERNNCIPFLDLLVKYTEDQPKINYEIYRKPTSNFRFIPNDSYHPQSQKRAAFDSMVHRLLTTPLSSEDYNKELNIIKEIAQFNGYSNKLVHQILNKKKKR